MQNLYEPPQAELALEAAEVRPPAYQLYSVTEIRVATFFGALFGGGVIMTMNYRRTGQSDETRRASLWTLLGTLGLIGLALALPYDVPSLVFSIAEAVLMVQLGKHLQRHEISRHLDRGGRLASSWGAAGIGILAILPIITVLMAFVLIFPELFA
ncbi:MAG: hypothetical protein AMJ69_07395 [Gammaproteobacteria bacterium SG8_47]|nr:MAG: hypothetical protein AMJ69_07395 [Gammaproteobacteria bacterium SG8_47]